MRRPVGTVEVFRAEDRPPRRLAVVIDQAVIVRDQVIGDPDHDLAGAGLFLIGLGDEVVVQRVEEIMPVQLVEIGRASCRERV